MEGRKRLREGKHRKSLKRKAKGTISQSTVLLQRVLDKITVCML